MDGGGVPQSGVDGRGLPWPGLDGGGATPAMDGGGGGIPAMNGGGGTLGTPPARSGWGTPHQHSEDLLRGGRYVSCVHAGGLSCYV